MLISLPESSVLSRLWKLKTIDPSLSTCTWEIKSASFLTFFLIHELISGVQSCRTVICYSYSLFILKSAYLTLWCQNKCVQSSKACTSPLSLHRVPEKSRSEATKKTDCADPRPVGHGNPHAHGSETNGSVKQKYNYIHVIISVIQLI